jgi:hypothetical protein
MALDRVSGDRIRELKEQRSRQVRLRLLVGLIALVIIVGSLVFISRTDQLQIKSVVVRGNYIVSSDDVIKAANDVLAQKYLWLLPKKNVFLYPNSLLTQKLHAAFPRFETISIHRENWSTLVIDVSERKNVYLWCDSLPLILTTGVPNCYYVDGHGYIFSRSPTFSGNVYFVFYGNYGWNDGDSPVGKRILTEDTFKQVIRFKEGLEQKQLPPHGFIVYPTGVDALLLSPQLNDSGQKIVFLNTQDIPTIYDNMISALASPDLEKNIVDHFDTLQYVDLRYDKKVYYKFGTDTQQTTSANDTAAQPQ